MRYGISASPVKAATSARSAALARTSGPRERRWSRAAESSRRPAPARSTAWASAAARRGSVGGPGRGDGGSGSAAGTGRESFSRRDAERSAYQPSGTSDDGLAVGRGRLRRVWLEAPRPVEGRRAEVARLPRREVVEGAAGRGAVPRSEEGPGQEPAGVGGPARARPIAKEAAEGARDLGEAPGVVGQPCGQEGGVVGEVGLLGSVEPGHDGPLPGHLPVAGDRLVDVTLPGGRAGEHEPGRRGLAGAGQARHRVGEPLGLGGAPGLQIGHGAQDGEERSRTDRPVDGVDLGEGRPRSGRIRGGGAPGRCVPPPRGRRATPRGAPWPPPRLPGCRPDPGRARAGPAGARGSPSAAQARASTSRAAGSPPRAPPPPSAAARAAWPGSPASSQARASAMARGTRSAGSAPAAASAKAAAASAGCPAAASAAARPGPRGRTECHGK